MTGRDLTQIDSPKTRRMDDEDAGPWIDPDAGPEIAIGQWYWVIDKVEWEGQWTEEEIEEATGLPTKKKLKKGTKVEWLACVMEVGSNYVELHAPEHNRSTRTTRVHLDNIEKELRFEPDADKIIKDNIARFQKSIALLLGEVQEVTKRLGVVPHTEIADRTGTSDNALAVVSSQVDTNAYKGALVKAKNEDLPALFKRIEESNHHLAKWMIAPTMPTRALMGPMKDGIAQIEDRIYTIELYAGLTEEAKKVADGDPAMSHEKLRVMQRRLYMDEECLLDYTHGGMEIKHVGQFDEWLSRPHNRDRILPFPRTLVAFRVRREKKEREDGGNFMQAFINAQIADADKKTFLYVRNGEQIWRIDCDFEFDEMIIPNRDDFDPSGEMMVKYFARRVDDMMPKARYDSLCETYAKHKAWCGEFENKLRPDKTNKKYIYWDSPFYKQMPAHFKPSEWHPFDHTNLYYDEALEAVEKEIKRYNRVAVIIQGLFDRSLALHPHPVVQVWNPESFARSVELIYDAQTLTYGDKPDFEAYRARLNASLGTGSIVTGQEDFWMRREAERENERQRNNWRDSHRRSNYKRLRPSGEKGPGIIAEIEEWKPRVRKAVFRWEKEVSRWNWRASSEARPRSIMVPDSELFNVSAYQPGDYKQFFSDPRTRAEYLRWAPLLLAAEDYHAGKLKLGQPGKPQNSWEL